MPVPREKLHEEVWAEHMTTVAKRYGVSSVYLARVCELLGVPRPLRGYWQQLAAGAKLERRALPAPEPGSPLEWVRDGGERRRSPPAAPTVAGRRKERTGPRPETPPLLIGARAHFNHAREGHDNEYVRSFKRSRVDIFVSREAIDRALAIANELFLALEDRGPRVMLAQTAARLRHSEPEHHMTRALALADKLNALQSLRTDIAKLQAELATKPPRRHQRPRPRRRPDRRRRPTADAGAAET